MKIRTIRLAAYGPFTDARIDFRAAGSDFHLLFGPNEAGKSSALRALRHMFFGIPARTADNFLHGYPHLRIGASLINRRGEKFEFVRRKGQAKTLRGADDETVLEEDSLATFLGGITQEIFEQMFAIGHDDLIRGGEEIISGKGRVGEALFAAGAGLTRLQRVQLGLEQDCGALFKPSGSTPAINRTIAALKAVRKDQKEALLLAKTWQAHDHRLRSARERVQAVRQALGQSRQRIAHLQRIRDALPLIARKKEIDARLAAFQDVPHLPDDFADKRRQAEKELSIAARDLERSRESVETINRRIDALSLPQALLQRASVIEALQHDLGSIRKAGRDRPALDGRRRTLRSQARQSLAAIDAEFAAESGRLFKLSPSTVGDIQELGKRYERLSAKLESAAAQKRKLETRLEHLTAQRRSMRSPTDISQLEAVVLSAQEAGHPEDQLADETRAADALAGDVRHRLDRQVLWRGPVDAVNGLPLPSRETIDRFDTQLDACHRRVEKQQEDKAKTQREIDTIRTELQAIELAQDVPTEADLNAVRTVRDRGWGLVRRELAGNPPSLSEREAFCRQIEDASDLPDAVEASMHRADHIADRLRREADRVSRKGLLEARRKQFERSLGDVEATLSAAVREQETCEAAWQKCWEPLGITPLPPGEMRGWLAEMVQIREKTGALRAARSRCERLEAGLAALKAQLFQAMQAVGAAPEDRSPLSRLIKTAQAYVKSQRELESRIAAADKEILTLRGETAETAAEAADLRKALDGWNADWEKNVRHLGLDKDVSPTAALAVIETIREAGNKFEEAEVLQKRIDGIDRDTAAFEARVADLVRDCAPELLDESRERAAELLLARLTAARKDESRQHALSEQLEAARKAVGDADTRISHSRAVIEALCREAHCQRAADLLVMEKRSRERDELVHMRDNLDEQLRRLSAGATVTAFIEQVAAVDADSIDPELAGLSEEIEKREQERSALDQTIGIETAERRRMDGSAAAADYAEKAERLLAGLEADVEQFARLKIAAVILARTIEQYREKHQGPLISRASELFSRMTLNAFSRLRAEYDEKGNPILVGVRSPTGSQVSVEGMSDGTADQLYLALRLASLEQYLENNEPLPFIVDDILLRFDDDRALATLHVLADLSRKTQILFFTHHQHLVELARGSQELEAAFNVHTLAG